MNPHFWGLTSATLMAATLMVCTDGWISTVYVVSAPVNIADILFYTPVYRKQNSCSQTTADIML